MGKTAISWTEETWNPVRGCTRVSDGCRNCYAEQIAARFSGPGQPFDGFAKRTNSGGRWTGKVALIPERLHDPRGFRKPRIIFVNSMSDLWHEGLNVPDIAAVYRVMQACPQHIFQVLTKRPGRRANVLAGWARDAEQWPVNLSNVWEGTSIEARSELQRISDLRETPAALRFLSIEPLLEDLGELDLRGIGWVIVGGESGPRHRPMRREWAESIRQQCAAIGVPFWFKQASGPRPETGEDLLGRVYQERPAIPPVSTRGVLFEVVP
jgi:protein gp37